ncbi:HAD-IIA family hydrolase [Antrihabitans sp. YC2-6]|uniref:HAD-IIA family hydrolase n=1 Tax=Antrihabitans sp. YC2-6 TaxID=2799498 RepID=UPI0018F5AEB7|nr:HAD-IIA family hydrolase [Antrihabitans sp. YC2-6]MBJ8348218.1 HAD-IIA family hydrolase [Antrihabitans sp. YC2-6]
MALRDGYDCLLADLDGTLYLGSQPIPGAADALEASAQAVLYVTNNASRSPAEVALHLKELGFQATDETVVTSSQAAARLLEEHVAPGSAVLVVGTEALADEVRRVGMKPVRSADPQPAAVVQGHSVETAWPILAEAAYAIRGGAFWVAANTDTTLPNERGLAPGNGSMVAALRAATNRAPMVAGKPAAPLMKDALRRCGTQSALVVGDRIDTDIAGGNEVGLDSLLVLTGVSSPTDLLRAIVAQRPTFVAFTLDAINHPVSRVNSEWSAQFDGTDIVLSGSGDPLVALAATAPVAWAHPEFAHVRGADSAAEAALAAWEARTSEGSTSAVAIPAATDNIS